MRKMDKIEYSLKKHIVDLVAQNIKWLQSQVVDEKRSEVQELGV
jgi:hypothetical protein